MKSSTDYAWLAGFFDGEGSVGLYKSRSRKQVSLHLTIVQKDRTILDLIASAYPEGKVIRRKQQHAVGLGKPCEMHFFRVYGRNTKRLLLDISPYVRVKKSQVEIALQFIDLLQPYQFHQRNRTYVGPEVMERRETLMAQMKAEKDQIRYLQ